MDAEINSAQRKRLVVIDKPLYFDFKYTIGLVHDL